MNDNFHISRWTCLLHFKRIARKRELHDGAAAFFVGGRGDPSPRQCICVAGFNDHPGYPHPKSTRSRCSQRFAPDPGLRESHSRGPLASPAPYEPNAIHEPNAIGTARVPGYKSLNTYPTGVGCQDDVLCNRIRAPATSNHYKRTASNKNPTAPPHGARLPGFGLCRIGGRTASGAVGRHEIGHGIEYIFRLIDQLLGRGWVVSRSKK